MNRGCFSGPALLLLAFIAGCAAVNLADERELTHTPGGHVQCPPGTFGTRATWDGHGKRTGAVCCRYGRCEIVNMDRERIDVEGDHAY